MRASEEVGKRASLLAFGHLLKRLRQAADLTQEELAERAMVSVRSISNLERGSSHRPRRDTIALLAEGLRLKGADREAFIALARGRSLDEALRDRQQAPERLTPPRPATPIVGRQEEIAAATSWLLDPEVRLLTMTGPGGVGKTRLALEVAATVDAAMRDGVVFVDLAPIRDPELVISAIAQAAGAVLDPERTLQQAVIAALRDKHVLLLLDNFEHVCDAAGVIADLLAACPMLTALVTSRVPLHVRAEHELAIAPLPLPSARDTLSLDALQRIPAVDLFIRRARAANSTFALTLANARDVSEIATRLDGLPLAIELAATRVKVLSPASLLARLERRLPLLTGGPHDLPARQQTLLATLDWSHDLLTGEEQAVFRRLAVFAGGCSLEAAEWVSGLGGRGPSPDTLDVVASLVDKSLLRVLADGDGETPHSQSEPGGGGHGGETPLSGRGGVGGAPRFGMLETIREYGLERLAAAGEEEEIRRQHGAWSIDLAARAEPELIGADQQRWFARLAMEHDNLRVALGWAIARHDAETAVRLAGTLYRFWASEGLYQEGRRWLEQALALDTSAISAPRGNALLGLGVMAFFQGDYDWAAALWQESLALFTALDDRTGIAYSHGNLGLIADAREEYDRAIAEYEAALALFRELNDQKFVAYMLHNLGLIAYFQGEYRRATALFEESLSSVRSFGDQNSVAMTLGNLGLVAFAEGDCQRALALQREALTAWRTISNKPWLARTIEHFAHICAAMDEPERATRLFAAAAALRAAFGTSLPPNDRALNDRYLSIAQSQLTSDAFATFWNEGEQMPLERAILYALGESVT